MCCHRTVVNFYSLNFLGKQLPLPCVSASKAVCAANKLWFCRSTHQNIRAVAQLFRKTVAYVFSAFRLYFYCCCLSMPKLPPLQNLAHTGLLRTFSAFSDCIPVSICLPSPPVGCQELLKAQFCIITSSVIHPFLNLLT